MMSTKLFKYFLDWWAPILAKLFSQINTIGVLPLRWKLSIVVPLYKHGDKLLPSSYLPISLLDTVSRMYSKYLLGKLKDKKPLTK